MEKKKINYTFFKSLLGLIFLIVYRPKFTNKANIPASGPMIVCGNHIHILDQCFPILSTKRMFHFFAKKEYFDSSFAWFFKGTGCICVDRSNHGGKSKEEGKNILDQNLALGIYPEGTRNSLVCKEKELNSIYSYFKNDIPFKKFKKKMKKNQTKLSQVNLLEDLLKDNQISLKEFKTYLFDLDCSLKLLVKKKIITKEIYEDSLLLPLKYGVVSLAKKTNAYIVPYGIKGKYKIFNNNLEIVFGTPFKVGDLSLEEANELLRKEITNLIKD